MVGHGVAWPKHPFLLRSCAREVDAATRRIKPDLIFSPGSNAIAYSNFLKPTIFWSDAPFGAMVDYYPWAQFQKLTNVSRRYGLEADTRALRYATAAIFRSNWARDFAIKTHRAVPERVHVLPLPGNLFRRWSLAEIQEAVPGRLKSPWKIFFSGVDWQRKGGDRAIAILNEAVKLGQPCEFYIAGLVPPARAMAAANFPVHALGRLSLNNPANRERLGNMLQESTFLLVPSTAEALGLVYCEALGAGVPSLATATGGVPDAVLDGMTGLLIDPNEPPEYTAKRMIEYGDPVRYLAMTQHCWQQWHLRFAMQAVLSKLTGILEKADAAGRAK
jgi:glycosyltransferase involved in cell wall biosynthesis